MVYILKEYTLYDITQIFYGRVNKIKRIKIKKKLNHHTHVRTHRTRDIAPFSFASNFTVW